MLPSTLREAHFACPPFPPWNLPSFTVESTLSSSCSRFDPPLPPRQGAALAHIHSLLLMIWYSGQTALFLLARAAPAFLPTALSVSLRPFFSFQQAQYAPVFAPFCTLFAGLGSTNKSAISLFLSDSRSVLSSIFPFISNFVADLAGTVFSPPVISGCSGSPDTRFSRGTTRLMSWPDGERYSRLPQSFVVSLFVSTLVFSRAGSVLSHLNSLAHRFPRFPLRNLCSLVMLAAFYLVYAATDTAFY